MISTISGTVQHKDLKHVIIDVSGIGYKVATTIETIAGAQENETLRLWTHLAVREDSLDLYGFARKEDLTFFELLISVSGIGPKSALGILNASSAEMLREAIASGDTSLLTKVSGVGKKSAEKIILELKDKVGSQTMETGQISGDADAIEALEALGYGQKEAREALKNIDKKLTPGEKVKQALKQLGSNIR